MPVVVPDEVAGAATVAGAEDEGADEPATIEVAEVAGEEDPPPPQAANKMKIVSAASQLQVER